MTKNSTRVQLDFTPRQVARLNKLMEDCDIQTRKELFNYAFTAFEWMVKQRRASRDIYSWDDHSDTRYALQLPALDNVEVEAELMKAAASDAEDYQGEHPKKAVGF